MKKKPKNKIFFTKPLFPNRLSTLVLMAATKDTIFAATDTISSDISNPYKLYPYQLAVRAAEFPILPSLKAILLQE